MNPNEEKPTTSKAAKDETSHNSQNNNNNTTTTSTSISAPLRTKFCKTVSSPTALSAAILNKPMTPTFSQVGKQGSINFRNSFLSDSDTDDQSLLLRTPSVRSHKFIIIPASSPLGQQQQQMGAGGRLPITTSTSSLTALQKLPLTRPQSIEPLGSEMQKFAKPRTPILTIPQLDQQQKASYPLYTPATLLNPTDVIHQSETFKSKNDNNNPETTSSGVKFTIEDYESDNATTDATATTTLTNKTTPGHISPTTAAAAKRISSPLDALYSQNILANIYSATGSSNNDNNSTTSNLILPQQQQQKSSSQTPLLTVDAAQPPASPYNTLSSVRPVSALLASNQFTSCSSASGTPSLGIGLRPRNDRNSSMRSVVSAYLNDPNELTINSFNQQQRMTSATNFGAYRDDSSSYLFRDNIEQKIYSDVTSVRSLASIGIGSTDGRRLVIRRVPQTPTELLNMVNPPTPTNPLPGVDDDDDDSFMDISDDSANLKPRQQHWANKMQFVLACIGYSVGLGNVWRFPYMCYKSGGGVFLVPYCIILIICSIPLLFMELSVGQYTGRGPIGALGQLCPLFKGAGLASVVVSFLMSTYYSVIIGYSIYYFFTSFKPEMPWVDCSNRWNTPDCWVPQRLSDNVTSPASSRTPSEEFFENKVLQISPGIEYPGMMRWELFACLICAWLMVYFATWKSIKSSAKVRYFTATFPFVLIIILMGRAVTLEGADEGLRYFFRPNWSELKNANVWINAASQNFNSLGITFGSMISFASYNKYNNNVLRDTVAVSVVNVLTSLLVGVFAFATLGNLALEQNTNVKDVIGDGPGLIFVVYPQAMSKMPYTQLWSVMFFFMLLCLGLNSQFAIVEVVVTSIQDGFPNWIRRHLGYHEIVVLIVCVISFLFGLPNLIQGGIYFFQLMDHYTASVSIMFLAFCQMIAVAWFYGTGRLSKNVKQMTGKAPSLYLKSCWILFGPCLLFAIWILSLINYQEPSYHNGRYKYPEWAYGIGWMFAAFSLVCIPGYALINLWRAKGHSLQERFQICLRPNIYECKICGEHHCEHDYPEQEQYMLTQEMGGVYKPAISTATTTHMGDNARYQKPPMFSLSTGAGERHGYNPMYMQQHQHQQPPPSPRKDQARHIITKAKLNKDNEDEENACGLDTAHGHR